MSEPRINDAGSAQRTDPLRELIRIADAVNAKTLAGEARDTLRRLDEGRFFVAVLGQFKRGKSTLINALVGASLLPTGVAPVTSVITVLRHGYGASARVQFRDGVVQTIDRGHVSDYVTERENPENVKGVLAVEVEAPSPLMKQGLCFVDTPGLGSVFSGNTSETREFVPHIDAAILVVGADPPIAGEELTLMETLGARLRELCVVISKADRVNESEMAEAKAFTFATLRRKLPEHEISIYEVSGREEPSTRDWPRLITALERLADRAGSTLVATARVREGAALHARLTAFVGEALGALQRPLHETEARVATLTRSADQAERALGELRHLFDAEQQRVVRDLEARRATYAVGCMTALHRELDHFVSVNEGDLRQRAMDHAQEFVEAKIRGWFAEVRQDVEAAFQRAAARFVDGARSLVTTVREASLGIEVPDVGNVETKLGARSGFYFRSIMTEGEASWAVRIADRLRTRERSAAAALQAALAYGAHLIDTNSRGVTGDCADRIVESRRALEAAIRQILRSAATAATEAAAHVREVHARGATTVQGEVERLTEVARALQTSAARQAARSDS